MSVAGESAVQSCSPKAAAAPTQQQCLDDTVPRRAEITVLALSACLSLDEVAGEGIMSGWGCVVQSSCFALTKMRHGGPARGTRGQV